jgi:hypothetical protein
LRDNEPLAWAAMLRDSRASAWFGVGDLVTTCAQQIVLTAVAPFLRSHRQRSTTLITRRRRGYFQVPKVHPVERIGDAIFWECVQVEAKEFDFTYYLSSDNIRQYLGLSVGYQWNRESQKIADIMDGMIVLSKDEWKEQRDEWISVNRVMERVLDAVDAFDERLEQLEMKMRTPADVNA